MPPTRLMVWPAATIAPPLSVAAPVKLLVPDTANVLLRLVAPVTVKVLPRLVAPVTARLLLTAVAPLRLTAPLAVANVPVPDWLKLPEVAIPVVAVSDPATVNVVPVWLSIESPIVPEPVNSASVLVVPEPVMPPPVLQAPQVGAVATPPDIKHEPEATSLSLDSAVAPEAYNKSPIV